MNREVAFWCLLIVGLIVVLMFVLGPNREE
jgi:hypothetical protein